MKPLYDPRLTAVLKEKAAKRRAERRQKLADSMRPQLAAHGFFAYWRRR